MIPEVGQRKVKYILCFLIYEGLLDRDEVLERIERSQLDDPIKEDLRSILGSLCLEDPAYLGAPTE